MDYNDLANYKFDPKIFEPVNITPSIELLDVESVDYENTPLFQILQNSKEQLEELRTQNDNLKELLKVKDQELIDSRNEAKTAKQWNLIMAIISFVSMIVAIASWAFPNIFSA